MFLSSYLNSTFEFVNSSCSKNFMFNPGFNEVYLKCRPGNHPILQVPIAILFLSLVWVLFKFI